MKTKFSRFMLDKNFNDAATLIFDSTLNVNVPQNVNLKISIDRDKNISDLATQMENNFNQINNEYSTLSFENMWETVFEKPELSEKQNLKENEAIVNNARTAYDNLMDKIKIQQYEQIYEATTLTLNSLFQGLINTAIQI